MKRWLLIAIVGIVLLLPACNSGSTTTHVPITTASTAVGPSPFPNEEAYDAIIVSPDGPVYWHHLVDSTQVSLGGNGNTIKVGYRAYIETRAGETRNNIVAITVPVTIPTDFSDISDSDISDFNDYLASVDLYTLGMPQGIAVWEIMGYIPLPFRPVVRHVLLIEISQEVQAGEYSFEIGFVVAGVDYGTVPCTIKVLE